VRGTGLGCSIKPEELTSIRNRLGLGRRELAQRLGVARSTVWRWESGVHPIEPISERLILILAESLEREGS
jgi:DNA-binding transcriptional regulator YiaG